MLSFLKMQKTATEMQQMKPGFTIFMDFILLCCGKLVYLFLWNATNLLQSTLHATCFSPPQPPSSIKVPNFRTKWTYIRNILQTARPQKFYNW